MPSPPRRSSRAQLPVKSPAGPVSTSTTSSLSSTRPDRSARSGVPPQSTTPHSRSSAEMSEPPRRSQRAHTAREDGAVQDPDNADDVVGDEEEVTRCICGHQDYPGPPLSEAFSGVDSQSDDAGGLFIQCDGCSVWQHGGCVGIIEESQSPDKYYCEECKPKQHELHTDAKGQNYSIYLPLYPKSHRKSSVSKTDAQAKKARDALLSRASTDPVTGRRRGTTRSKEHDDEEEQLLRAIEESKREVAAAGPGRRAGKRGRDDSEDSKHDIKRQRTASDSLTSVARTVSQADESDDETGDGVTGRSKKIRSDPTSGARQAELREKEKERERARAEAAGRRQERAGRRRADESEPSDETPAPGTTAKTSPPPSSLPPSPPTFAAPDKVSHKKGPGKRVKKLGNNQYTKARELSNQMLMSSPHSKKRQLAHHSTGHSSGDEQSLANGQDAKASPAAHEHTNGVGRPPGRSGRGRGKAALNGAHLHRHDEPVERTFTNMKRSMDGMMAFMQRHQVEIAGGDQTPPGFGGATPRGSVGGSGSGSGTATTDGVPAGGPVQFPDASNSTKVDGEPESTKAATPDDPPFDTMNSMEMADVLARKINRWNTMFAQYA